MLLVEQNVRQTLEIADRAYVLENGRICLEGECCELIENDFIKPHIWACDNINLNKLKPAL